MQLMSDSIRGKSSASGSARHRRWRARLVSTVLTLVTLSACSGGSKYFQDAINQATRDMVGKRYGTPHKTQATVDGGEAWTYFERGSGTAGFGGQVRGTGCRAYVLTFDKEMVLRGWEQLPCQG